jgi:hypothetical protein
MADEVIVEEVGPRGMHSFEALYAAFDGNGERFLSAPTAGALAERTFGQLDAAVVMTVAVRVATEQERIATAAERERSIEQTARAEAAANAAPDAIAAAIRSEAARDEAEGAIYGVIVGFANQSAQIIALQTMLVDLTAFA